MIDLIERIKLRNLSLLFVDDDPTVRFSIYESLHNIFSSVHIAKDGEEALDIVRNNIVDILVTDINMPNIDGIELIKEVRKKHPIMPIIVASAYQEFNDVYNDVELMYILNKPFSVIDILSIVDSIEFDVVKNKVSNDAYCKLEDSYREARFLLDFIKGKGER